MTRPSSDFFKSSSMQSSNERIEASQFSMRYSSTRRSCANWGRANVGNVHNNNNQPSKKRPNHAFRQLTLHFIVEKNPRVRWSFQAAWFNHQLQKLQVERFYVVAFWSKHGLRSDLKALNLKILSGEACRQTPLACSHLCIRSSIGRTTLKQLAILQP